LKREQRKEREEENTLYLVQSGSGKRRICFIEFNQFKERRNRGKQAKSESKQARKRAKLARPAKTERRAR